MASGNTLLTVGPLSNEPPSANYATLDLRNSHPCLDFDAATIEYANFSGILPAHYAGGGLTLKIHWSATSATSGNVVWNAAIEAIASLDIDADSFATAQTATGTANGTSGVETITTITFSSGANMDSLAAGGAFRLQVSRNATSGSDTMTGDAELLYMEILET